MRTLRRIAALWLYCLANCCDNFGAAMRDTFGTLGDAAKPRPRRRPTKVPSWYREAVQVSDERATPRKASQ